MNNTFFKIGFFILTLTGILQKNVEGAPLLEPIRIPERNPSQISEPLEFDANAD